MVRRTVLAATVVLASLVLVPAASAAELLAAFDRYVTGQGFEIGLVNAATGATRTLPAGVNTADDELHPALSPDGRFLVFTRMKLLPKLNGDIVPPTDRSLIHVDLQTGTQINLGNASGAVFTQRAVGGQVELAFGLPPAFASGTEGNSRVARSVLGTTAFTAERDIQASVDRNNLDIPHAASIRNMNNECVTCTVDHARYLALAYHDPITGALQSGTVRLHILGFPPSQSQTVLNLLEFGAAGEPAGHPVPRAGDHYVAFHLGSQPDIQSLTYPGETTPTVAPAPITTSSPERMPAWSPDGLKLGFIRTTGGRRKLGIFDLTPGIQAIVNPLVDLGPDAPTAQTRQFQSVFGGLSLGVGPGTTTVSCTTNCLQAFAASTAAGVSLVPSVVRRISGQTVGIFVVRVTGKRRKVLGRSVPRIRVVGRVPLGTVRNGRNRFRWNGRVGGKRLAPGTYLLTYRALKGKRVTTTSGSLRFRITRGGEIRGVRRER